MARARAETTLVDHRGRNYLKSNERTHFLAATREDAGAESRPANELILGTQMRR